MKYFTMKNLRIYCKLTVREFGLCKYGREIVWAKVASIRDKHFDPL